MKCKAGTGYEKNNSGSATLRTTTKDSPITACDLYTVGSKSLSNWKRDQDTEKTAGVPGKNTDILFKSTKLDLHGWETNKKNDFKKAGNYTWQTPPLGPVPATPTQAHQGIRL